MRQLGLTCVAMAGLALLGTPLAEAGVSCRIIPSWCPHAANNEPNFDKDDHGGIHTSSTTTTSVPEPATLILLGIGAGAVGVAVRRRRKGR
jgi:hypothetical protein